MNQLRLDSHSSRLRLIGFGNLYFKDAIPIGRFDAIGVHGLCGMWKERENLPARLDLGGCLTSHGWLFKKSLATECQYALVYFRFEIRLSHPGQLGAK